MYRSILEVLNIAKSTKRIAWGWQSQKSNRNISWVISSKFNPVLAKMVDPRGEHICQIKAVHFDESSDIDRIRAVTAFLRRYNFAHRSEIDAIYWLTETLEILTLEIPSGDNIKQVHSDSLYCIFCYRDHQEGHETCGTHAGLGRMQGQRYFRRYVEMKHAIREYEHAKSTKFEAIAVRHFLENGIPPWTQVHDNGKLSWVTEVLKLLDATHLTNTPHVLKRMAQELLGSSDFPEPYWPCRLNGLMFRFQAYQLCQYKRPEKPVAERLEMIWENQSIQNVAEQTNSTPFNIQRSLDHWQEIIQSDRNKGIPDELIKAARGLKCLPPPPGEPPTTKRPSVLSAPTRGG